MPTEVIDYVIIGAGATGTSMAYQLSRPGGAAAGKSVVILDAKDVASGACESCAGNGVVLKAGAGEGRRAGAEGYISWIDTADAQRAATADT